MRLSSWRVNPETGFFEAILTTPDGGTQTVQIASQDEIASLLAFLQDNYGDEVDRWLLSSFRVLEDAVRVVYPSSSGGSNHEVERHYGRWTCTCLAYAYGKVCWAMARVLGEVSRGETPAAREET